MKTYYFSVLFGCLLAGCGGPVTPSNTFYLKVERAPANSDPRQETVVTFQTPPKAEISVGAGQDRSSITFDAINSDVNRECVVRLAVERQESQTDDKSNVAILIRLEMQNGPSAGGPSIYTVDANKSLNSMLDVTVAEGDFALDEPVTLGTSNGDPITLVVRPIRDL